MNHKIVAITGANSGIGKAAAVRFAREGYSVVMACRSLEKGEAARQEIVYQAGSNNVDLMKVDMSSYHSIETFSSEFEQKYDKLDILIHNAGYFRHGEKVYQSSSDNIELSFATNAFGPFYMTRLLEKMLIKSEDARILNACTTNIRHFFDPKRKIEFDNIQGELKDSRPYNSYKMYGDSKMAFLLLTFHMAELYKNSGIGIKVNAVQIPAIKLSKETMNKFKSLWRIAAKLQNIYSASPESMADTYFHICTSDELNNITGKLINDKRQVMKPSHYANTLLAAVKQLSDQTVYPKYADQVDNINKVWDFAIKVTPEIK
jgi:NAD(P)-dependent dehydrogenase (short-subunit alcohol dehydrogenase family)